MSIEASRNGPLSPRSLEGPKGIGLPHVQTLDRDDLGNLKGQGGRRRYASIAETPTHGDASRRGPRLGIDGGERGGGGLKALAQGPRCRGPNNRFLGPEGFRGRKIRG